MHYLFGYHYMVQPHVMPYTLTAEISPTPPGNNDGRMDVPIGHQRRGDTFTNGIQKQVEKEQAGMRDIWDLAVLLEGLGYSRMSGGIQHRAWAGNRRSCFLFCYGDILPKRLISTSG